MAFPQIPFWATNTNYSTGPDGPTNPAGAQPTKVDPGAGVYADGFVPGTGAVSAWLNWLVVQLIAVLTFVYNQCWGGGTQEHTYETPKVRVIFLDAAVGNGYNPSFLISDPTTYLSWFPTFDEFTAFGGIRSAVNGAMWHIPIKLPVGTLIQSIKVRAPVGGCVGNAARGAGNRCRIVLVDSFASQYLTSGPPEAFTAIATAEIVDTGIHGSLTTMDLTGLSGGGYSVQDGHTCALVVVGGTDGGSHVADQLDVFRLQFVDYGPRNA